MAGLSVGELGLRTYTRLPSPRDCAMRSGSSVFDRAFTSVPLLFTLGSIPQFYRDVYSAMCHGSATKVCKEVWMSCLKTASLPESVLEQVIRA